MTNNQPGVREPLGASPEPADNYKAFAVEQRGIDFIPSAERHGSPMGLFFVWMSTYANVTSIIAGAIVVASGLSFWQAVIAIALGNLGLVLVGMLSLPGPRAGTSGLAVTRAQYGHHGNRIPAIMGWIAFLGYEASDLVLITLAGLVILNKLGVPESTPLKVIVILVACAIQLPLPLYGHATIVRVFKWLAVAFAAVSILMAVLLVGRINPSGAGHSGGFVAFTLGLTIIFVNGPMSWPNASDYSRYLPKSTSKSRIVLAVTLGTLIPCVGLELLGAGLATIIPNASDLVNGLPAAFPGWFVIPYLLFAIVAIYAINTIDLYSSGLTLQAAGLKVKRWVATCIDLVICVPFVFLVVFSSGFSRYYTDFLMLLVVLYAPLCSIMFVDMMLRRGVYDPSGLLSRRTGVYWRNGGLNWAGLTALAAGMLTAALCVDTPDYVGPISQLLNGADISVVASAAVSGLLYLILARRSAVRETRVTVESGRDGEWPDLVPEAGDGALAVATD